VTFLFGQPITLLKRVKRTQPDSFGNDVFDAVPQVTVTGAFNPGTSVELVQGEDILTTQPTVMLPPGTQVAAIDAVQVDGLVYEVDGSPNAPVNPFTGWQPGVVVKLKRVTG
jgi:hypothetical protein